MPIQEDDEKEDKDHHPIDVEVTDGDIQRERVENTLKPFFSDKLVDQMALSMKNTIMVKLLRRTIGFHTVHLPLQTPKGSIKSSKASSMEDDERLDSLEGENLFDMEA
ncbi:hypothetical protein Syun_025782 [Stephania yunnanensis]|uniref:Uncharacterized protein n=1 Tax=Stephania yunnanensis TaxID=152371 RepID=A0AAP0EV82_9MAGN